MSSSASATVSAEDYAPPVNTVADAELDIVACMNSEHPDELLRRCRHEFGGEASEAMMVGLDCDGFDLRARYGEESKLLRFDFEQPVADARSARAAFAAVNERRA